MKKLKVSFFLNEEKIVKTAFINDDINADDVLDDVPENKGVSVEFGMGNVLGIWEMTFTEKDGTSYECDFKSILHDDDTETLTLKPVEVLVWSKSGKSLHNNIIPFDVVVG